MSLPVQFSDWFQAKGWTAYPHQLEMVERVSAGQSILLLHQPVRENIIQLFAKPYRFGPYAENRITHALFVANQSLGGGYSP